MEEKIFELLTQMYSELNGKMDNMQNQLNGMQGRMDGMQNRMDNMHTEIKDLKKIVMNIETDHGNKLDALFDGYRQNAARLERIEAQVSKHEEFIIQRIK